MLNFDELYNGTDKTAEKGENDHGQILVQRNLLSHKFEFITFVDISGMTKDKKQKAIKTAKSL